ncbi:hypothetical protein AAFF_G00401060 [Aldrovandia affinis]|uniref:VPS37 C-terminal domain-containing protein n=1 Tax=Aldrovandia affinis TaxID=143900 RepID=A0AAD7SCG8_9TELE|nr:hypothetical protein AAFF_G00401060 [Aldrovandia affinis]
MTQLNELLEDDEKLNNIVQELEETQSVQQAKETTLAGNRSLAEQNLLLQPRLDCQKNELTQRYRLLQELFEAYQLRKSTLDNNSGSGSLDTLLALLQTEGAKIEEETENMADSFLEGGQPLDSFIDDYQSKRKLAHLRRVKIDKLRDMAEPPAASQPAGYPYPHCPYPSRSGSHILSYPTPYIPQYAPTLPERPLTSAPRPASSCSDWLPCPWAPPTKPLSKTLHPNTAPYPARCEHSMASSY